ncbi:hypothetical protein QSU92_16150 [Microbacterium sp. ET2]|uniref:hypothetical protein n=1 Tax=Microbacterium albipurpureum TaxID=3050384 RepID=UPI00259D0DF5|nr:hypothetical protein [Microbacterium sp. ET2 (Ac-2212)]WJL95440.1 hypothetical protein QSU92_16150 [Microbacterium sp. ET2 (Ac-2212)]
MGVLSRFRRRRRAPYRAVTEEEQISRYVYLLNTLPAAVIESAHATAFRDLPLERRREMLAELRPFLNDAERRDAEAEPGLLATLVRRAEHYRRERSDGLMTPEGADSWEAADPRSILMSAGVMTVVAQQFLLTQAVTAYFTVGAGSLMLAEQPGWLVDTVDPTAGSVDAAGWGGDGGFGGGGFGDGGLGGMDAGGFSGGFG